MLMNKIGASCGPFNCVKVHWSVHTMVNVTKKTLETTLAVLCWIVKTARSSLAVKRKFVRREPQEGQFFAINWATPLRNRSNHPGGTFEVNRGSIWRAKAWKFAFPPFLITQQDFTTKEVGNVNLFVLIDAWPVSREQQEHAFSEESTICAVPLGRSETAPYQRGCDSSKFWEEQQLSMLRKAACGSPTTWVYDIFHRLPARNWLLQHPSGNVVRLPYRRAYTVLYNRSSGKFFCFSILYEHQICT